MRHGVRPLGDLLLEDAKRRRLHSPADVRAEGLGTLARLPDDVLLELLARLDPRDLARLGRTSRAAYAFTRHDELWRQAVLRECGGRFRFAGATWMSAYVNHARRGGADGWTPAAIDAHLHSDVLFLPWLCATQPIRDSWLRVDNVDRRAGLSLRTFVDEYETPNRPVVITDVVRRWPAFGQWTRAHLVSLAGDQLFEVGPVEMTLDAYWAYADAVVEESPLYLFDKTFAAKVPQLAAEYNVPEYFAEDLFSVLGEDARLDYRWLIIGPAKSGSAFHVDPNATSAWNACVTGSKKWIMYPPGCIPPGVHPSADGAEVTSTVSLMEWFMNFYAATREGSVRPIEFVARAGDLVFVPSGWFHLVMNLEESVAVTQNYVSRRNLRKVLHFLRHRQALISGLRQCGGEAALHDAFRAGLTRAFPGELETLEAEWCAPRVYACAELWSRRRQADQAAAAPGVWRTLRAGQDRQPFMFAFGAPADGSGGDDGDDDNDGDEDSVGEVADR